jgi:Flp pilus assembly protein TadG
MERLDHNRLNETGPNRRPVASISIAGRSKGQALVQFAIVVPIFFLMVCAVMDNARLFLVQMNVQQAVQDASRYASTGNHQPDPKNPGKNLQRIASIIAVLQQEVLSTPGVNPQNVQITSDGKSNFAGGPGDTVTITLVSAMPLMTPLIAKFFGSGSYTFTSSATFKNEPFDPNNTN